MSQREKCGFNWNPAGLSVSAGDGVVISPRCGGLTQFAQQSECIPRSSLLHGVGQFVSVTTSRRFPLTVRPGLPG